MTINEDADVTSHKLFNCRKRLKTVIIEREGTEIYHKDNGFTKLEQYFIKSSCSKKNKRKLIDNFASRCFVRTFMLLCGELNIIKIEQCTFNINDEYGFIEKLASTDVILNPCHTYMVRHEMNKKRKAMSANERLLVSVWNTGSKKDAVKGPWIAFRDEKDITENITELNFSLPNRNDVAIGILEINE